MVGAGGIGCELLKTLVMSGYKDIELVSRLLFFCMEHHHLAISVAPHCVIFVSLPAVV